MKRRDFLKVAGYGTAALVMPACAQTPQRLSKGKKPNIVYIMLDELAYFELSCMGNKYLKTPNIDRMATEGMRFTQALAGAPVCRSYQPGRRAAACRRRHHRRGA